MLKLQKASFLLLVLLAYTFCLSAQCPSSITATTTTTAVTCPSNGSITVNSNVPSGTPGVSYQITLGPSGGGYQTSAQTSNIFNSLPPGDYTIKISCDVASTTVNASIANSYSAPVVNATVSNVCNRYIPGGTITFNSTGSASPLQYAVLLSTNASEPDANFTYVSTNTFDVTTFGTYQARVKDACGNFNTQTISIQPTFPKVTLAFDSKKPADDCSGYIMYYRIYREGTTTPIDLGTIGYKMEIWESTNAGCTGLPTTTPDKVITEKGSTILRSYNSTGYTASSFYWRITSPCGEVTQGCANTGTFSTSSYISVGCAGPASPVSFVLKPVLTLAPYTLTITGYDAANNVTVPAMSVTSSSQIFTGIPYAHHYIYTVQTKCGGLSFTGTNTTPTTAPTYSVFKSLECTNVLGTSRVGISLGGAVPDIASMTIADATLVSATGGATFAASSFSIPAGNLVYFNNVPPGNYILKLKSPNTAGCQTDIPVTITVGGQLNYSLDGTSAVQCGGTGNITVKATTNTTASIYYKLLNAAGTEIQQNANGTFTNLPVGNYTVIGGINVATCAGTNYEVRKAFTIADPNVAPIISKKYGIVCEPSGQSGLASFEFTGAAPYLLEMKKNTETNYTTIATNVPATYTANNLEVNQTYDIRITDACGKTGTSQVTIQPLGPITKLTTVQPCVGQPYTLSVEEIPGATYAWSYNNGPVFSTSSSISFSSYSANNDGNYRCTVSIGSCVTREANYTINSNSCGSPLFVNFGNISATIKNGVFSVSWTALTEKNHDSYEISSDGKTFRSIGSVKSKSVDGNSASPLEYNFEKTATGVLGMISLLAFFVSFKRKKGVGLFAIIAISILAFGGSCNKQPKELDNLSAGESVFVRIATIDKDGVKGYSKIVKVVSD